jgi:hypothetical protein
MDLGELSCQHDYASDDRGKRKQRKQREPRQRSTAGPLSQVRMTAVPIASARIMPGPSS